MFEFYPQIKAFHVGFVFASVSLFALRGLLSLAGIRWVMAAPMRYLSYAIDTALLTSALMLLTILPGAVFANHWLTVKLSLLVVYVVLGSFALKRGRTRRIRAICYLAALVVIVMVYGIARQHHPLGWFSGLIG
jgi:uncharacterized membrane protein SirB2